ncbi:MAG: MBL fold metallo-hydrolase [Bacteroidota bacterium]
MALSITSLNSGSNGNCYYIGNESEAILVDAGITCRETEKRMHLLGLDLRQVKAIFVSHEHIDHVKGLQSLSEKYMLPVYVTDTTFVRGGLRLRPELTRNFSSTAPVHVGGLSISAFPKYHDAADPHSFIISCHGITVGVFTDIGAPCERLTRHFSQCHAAFLEANYDESLLENGRYPYFLKNRIRGGNGHLSNKQALDVFTKHRPTFMSHLLLSHLSKDNNCPILARDLFQGHANGTEIIIASRFEQTPVYTITAGFHSAPLASSITRVLRPTQLSLFQ